MPRLPSPGKKTRLNLEMDESVRSRLESLREGTKADSLSEVIRHALAAYELLVTTSVQGGQVLVRDARGKEREVLILRS